MFAVVLGANRHRLGEQRATSARGAQAYDGGGLDAVVAQVVASPFKRLKIATTHLKAEDPTMGDEYLQQIVEIVI